MNKERVRKTKRVPRKKKTTKTHNALLAGIKTFKIKIKSKLDFPVYTRNPGTQTIN